MTNRTINRIKKISNIDDFDVNNMFLDYTTFNDECIRDYMHPRYKYNGCADLFSPLCILTQKCEIQYRNNKNFDKYDNNFILELDEYLEKIFTVI
jgi:hypothetical protein